MNTKDLNRETYLRMPHVEPNMTVGLFGGSFNPPHEGHLLVAQTAIRKLKLDQLWWIVTPGNPLKSHGNLATLGERIACSKALVRDPRIRVTAFEAAQGLHYTAQTLKFVLKRNIGVRFAWVMGADNLANFHKWQHWQTIAQSVPIAIIDRPGSTLSFLSSIMAKRFDYARIDEDDAARLPHMQAPAWTFIHGPRSHHSSTAIRQNNLKGA